MTISGRRVKMRAIAAAAIVGVALSGCSAGDVELNGRLLDAVGISTAALGAKGKEPQVAQRAPLVIPPDQTRVPEPGSVPVPPPVFADQSWPADRDQQKVADAAQKQQKQKEYCRDGNWRERAMGDDIAASKGPYGTCDSIFTWAGGLFGSGD